MHKLCPTLIDCIYIYHFTKKIYPFFLPVVQHYNFFYRFCMFLSHLLLFFFLNNFFFDLVVQPAVPSIAPKWIPVTRAVHSWTAGGAKGKLCTFCWLLEEKSLCRGSCWKADERLSFLICSSRKKRKKKRRRKTKTKKTIPMFQGTCCSPQRSLLETGAAQRDQTVSQ